MESWRTRKRPVLEHWRRPLMLFLLTPHYSLQGRRERMSDSIIDSAQRCPMMSICSTFILSHAGLRRSRMMLLNVFCAACFNRPSFTMARLKTISYNLQFAEEQRKFQSVGVIEYKYMGIKTFFVSFSLFLLCSKPFSDWRFRLQHASKPSVCLCVCWMSIISCKWLDPVYLNAIGAVE